MSAAEACLSTKERWIDNGCELARAFQSNFADWQYRSFLLRKHLPSHGIFEEGCCKLSTLWELEAGQSLKAKLINHKDKIKVTPIEEFGLSDEHTQQPTELKLNKVLLTLYSDKGSEVVLMDSDD
ncbi:hypothetical protein P879_05560 [Paragonimus westermani]|uniref:Uncharacterized protein n=1 Tax=Paragonimus westermani TaxID=34504 RepID=A0A8T0D5J6_9TREM|nr:hypothetical protein P879_05560 [Paragonimus westermani]